ncbi:hypothetical protein QQZ08_007792 [Neonectria magnoliae]|uniref:Uncharacterized protein n=1 Tax=Neonectria magnoliae TaxID=2732573 RepID=A0ABR1HWP0_9HYPO
MRRADSVAAAVDHQNDYKQFWDIVFLVHDLRKPGTKKLTKDFDFFRRQLKQHCHDKSFGLDSLKFDMEDVLQKEGAISKLTEKLSRKLAKLQNRRIYRPGSRPTSSQDLKSQQVSFSNRGPHFLLVGQGLGCWVLRNFLNEKSHSTTAIWNTTTVLFIDDNGTFRNNDLDQYQTFLSHHQTKFRPGQRSNVHETLPSDLRNIDMKFDYLSKELYSFPFFHRKLFPDDDDAGHQKHSRFQDLKWWGWKRRLEVEDQTKEILREMTRLRSQLGGSTDLVSEQDRDVTTESSNHQSTHTLSRTTSDTDLASKMISTQTGKGSVPEDRLCSLQLAREPKENDEPSPVEDHPMGDFVRVDDVPVKRLSVLEESEMVKSSMEKSLRRACARIPRGQYRDAIEELKFIAMRQVDNAERLETKKWLGLALMRSGKHRDALDEFKSVEESRHSEKLPDKDRCGLYCYLALAYAYESKFAKCEAKLAKARRDGSGELGYETEHLPVTTEEGILLTEAETSLVSGEYREGLQSANSAWDKMNKHLGRRNLRVLGAAQLRAQLLALNSEISEAESLCRNTLTLMSEELGDGHPETLETTAILICIFRLQGRLTESIYLGEILCRRLEDQDYANPTARAELAAAYLSAGHYSKAADELRSVIHQCESDHTWNHTSTLRFLSQLALVWYRSCYFEDAEKLVLGVLEKQHALYSRQRHKYPTLPMPVYQQLPKAERLIKPILRGVERECRLMTLLNKFHSDTSSSGDLTKPTADLIQSLKADEFFEIKDVVLDSGSENTVEEGTSATVRAVKGALSKLVVHPFLLDSLQLAAAIQLQKPKPDIKLAVEVLSMTFKWRKVALGEQQLSTLAAEFELGVSLRAKDELKKARAHFDNVYQQRLRILEKSHPDTLSARLELSQTTFAIQMEEDELAAQGKGSLEDRAPDLGELSQDGQTVSQSTPRGPPLEELQSPLEEAERSSREILMFQEAMSGSSVGGYCATRVRR